MLSVIATTITAQTFTKEDSGWVPLFNGKDFSGLYSRMYNKEITPTIDPIFTVAYSGTDSAEIHVAKGGGEIGTIRSNYSHYRVRIQYKFDSAGNYNAGLLYGVDETVPRMGNKWPRSIECQMLQGQAGAGFSIQQVTFDTKITNNAWDPNGAAKKACQYGCDARWFQANPLLDKSPGWNSMEALVRGSDSAYHMLKGTVVFKLWNIRLTDTTGKTLSPYNHGAIGLEAENAVVHYRRFEVMELPPDGPNFLNRFFIATPGQGEQLASGSLYKVTWRTLGSVAKVKLEYNTGAGWKPIADSAANTGSFDWTVPMEVTKTLRIRVSGPSWARADTSGDNAIVVEASTHKPGSSAHGAIAFTIDGSHFSIADIRAYSKLEILDVFGREIRAYAIAGSSLHWNRLDNAGLRVRAGIYFIHLSGANGERVLRTLVF